EPRTHCHPIASPAAAREMQIVYRLPRAILSKLPSAGQGNPDFPACRCEQSNEEGNGALNVSMDRYRSDGSLPPTLSKKAFNCRASSVSKRLSILLKSRTFCFHASSAASRASKYGVRFWTGYCGCSARHIPSTNGKNHIGNCPVR